LKWFDTIAQEQGSVFAWKYTQAGTFTPLNDITKGTGVNQRISNMIILKRLSLQGAIMSKIPSSLNITQVKCRTVIVWDKDAGGGDLTISSLFVDPGYPASSPFNLDNRAEHVILWDHLWVSGYIHRNVSTVETYWTLQERTATTWNLLSWPSVAIAPAPNATPPTITINTFYDNQVIDQGGGVGSTAGHQNSVITFACQGKMAKKMKKDMYLDLYTVFKEAGPFPISTGKLWIVTVRDPDAAGLGSSDEFSLEATVRLRYIDR